jgi:hypothetical protein
MPVERKGMQLVSDGRGGRHWVPVVAVKTASTPSIPAAAMAASKKEVSVMAQKISPRALEAQIVKLEGSSDPQVRAEAKRIHQEFRAEIQEDDEISRKMGLSSVSPTVHMDGRSVVCPVMTREQAEKNLAAIRKRNGFTGG